MNRSLRLWPAVITVAAQWFLWVVVPRLFADGAIIGLMGGLACGLLVLLWWLFFSRAPWIERLTVTLLMVVAVVVTKRLVDRSIENGMMGLMLPLFSIPAFSLALVSALTLSRRASAATRRASVVAAILVACGVFTMLRTDGVTGDGDSDLHWRWTPTAEARLLAQSRDLPPPAAAPPSSVPPPSPAAAVTDPVVPAPAARPVAATPDVVPASAAPLPAATDAAEWPGFRGPGRDGVVTAVPIATDWAATPPTLVWKRPVGPGWSSFAVKGDFIYTQEQRGDHEVVSCYRLSTGEPVWAHKDPVRFYESNGGAGPRGTPTLHGARVYAFGATGILNALDASTGRLIWSRNAAGDTRKATPGWGFASSPLVHDDLVIVGVSGQLAAYDAATGTPRWKGPSRGGGYSSPHLTTIDGVTQIVFLSGGGAAGVDLSDGRLLWEHAWEEGVSIVQPGLADGDVLVSGGDAMGGIGLRRIDPSRGPAGWNVETRWSTRGLKPYFNDFVVHKGHAYGFDGLILAAVDLADGTRKWKGGRYGAGQMILLPDQDLLLVLAEEGDLALVKAAPDQFTEVARVPGIEGKTWNHPVLVGDLLLVRNGEQMAAFRLSRR